MATLAQRCTVDCHFRQDYPANNYNEAYLWVGRWSGGDELKSFVYFDVSSIPSTAIINSAYLYLYQYDYSGWNWYNTTTTLGVKLIGGSWTETGVTWNNHTTYSIDNNYVATWTGSSDNPVFDVTTHIRHAITGTHYGFCIYNTTANSSTNKTFRSGEYGTTTLRPYLVVDYTPNTAPYWNSTTVTASNSTQDANGVIREDQTTIRVAWSAASDAQGDTLTYQIYREVSTGGETLIYNSTYPGTGYFDDTGCNGAGGVGYRYRITVYDGQLYGATSIYSNWLTKNTFTGGVLSQTGSYSMLYATTNLPMARTNSTNTWLGALTNTYTLSCTDVGVTLTNGANCPLDATVSIATVGAMPRIALSNLISVYSASAYQGVLHFKLTASNGYSSRDTFVNITLDIRTTPYWSGSVFDATPYTNGTLISGTTYFGLLGRYVTIGWANALNAVTSNADILYDIDYKLTTEPTVWTNAATGLTVSTANVYLPIPSNGAAALVYNVRVRSRMAYGLQSAYTTCGTNVTVSRYYRTAIVLDKRTRLSQSASIEISVAKNMSTNIDAIDTISTFTYSDQNAVAHDIAAGGYDNHFSTGNIFLQTTSYTMNIVFQDNIGTALGSANLTLGIPINAYTPKFSVRRLGLGFNAINDGTGNHAVVQGGSINSIADDAGRKGYYMENSPVHVITGAIMMWPVLSVPTGYLSCNGENASRTTYANLFDVLCKPNANAVTFNVGYANSVNGVVGGYSGRKVIFTTTGSLPTGIDNATVYYLNTDLTGGNFTVSLTDGGANVTITGSGTGAHSMRFTTYGIADATTFKLPDLRVKFPLGINTDVTAYDTPGKTGGSATHTLTTAEIPSHAHEENSGLVNIYGSPTASFCQTGPTYGFGYGDANLTTGTAGSGNAHNNMPPFLVVYYIIKT